MSHCTLQLAVEEAHDVNILERSQLSWMKGHRHSSTDCPVCLAEAQRCEQIFGRFKKNLQTLHESDPRRVKSVCQLYCELNDFGADMDERLTQHLSLN